MAADQESDAAFMARVEPPPQQQRGKGKGKKKAAEAQQKPLQQHDRKSGKFLTLEESVVQGVAEVAADNMTLSRLLMEEAKRREDAEARAHTTQKKNARLENELSAVQKALVQAKEKSEADAADAKKQASARLGQATKETNKLQRKYDDAAKSEVAIAALKARVGELELEQTQAAKDAKRKDRQVAYSETELAKEEAKHASVLQALMANLEAAEAAAAAEKELRRELMEEYTDESLLGAARKLLTGEELEEALRVPSLGSIGSSCSSVGDLGPRRRRDMGKVVGMLMGRILEIAFAGEKKDPRKVLEAALERRGLGDTALGVAMAQEGGYEKEMQSKLAVAAGPYSTRRVSRARTATARSVSSAWWPTSRA